MNRSDALQRIVRWGNNQANVDVLLLTGSLAGDSKTDHLSDIDLAVFGSEFNFIKDNSWLTDIGDCWVCVHDSFVFEGSHIPTRLTIFDGGLKVDFSFHPIQLLINMSGKVLPDTYRNGYKVLLDKKGITNYLHYPDHKAFYILKPGAEMFNENQKQFWFECYHIAKYLERNDVWTAKVRDAAAKSFLLRMLEWRHAVHCNGDFRPKPDGREMQSWLEHPLWNLLFDCHGGFDAKSSWNALEHTMACYRLIAKETAALLFFDYNLTLDENISYFIKELQEKGPKPNHTIR
jgi:aminoglycoside 6-adenylyltransferase